MPDEPRIEPVTDEERERARQARAQLKRDLAEAAKRPRPPVTSPGKFTGPIGVDDDGNFLPPLTPEQKAHKEAVRRRARERAQSAGGQAPRASIIDRTEGTAERTTAARLAERLPDRELHGSDHVGSEYVDQLGNTYHVLRASTESELGLWDAGIFTTAVGHLLRKQASSFVVVDLTGATPEQVAAVRSYVDGLPPEQRAKIIALGF